MSKTNKKLALVVILLVVLGLGPYTVISRYPLTSISSDPAKLASYFQRIIGLVFITLIFFQVVFARFKKVLTQKFGLRADLTTVVLAAPSFFAITFYHFLYMYFIFKIKGIFDPFYVFTEVCLLCTNRFELLYTLARVSFWLVTASFLAFIFDTSLVSKKSKKWFEYLNYLAFYFFSLHFYLIESDAQNAPFSWFFYATLFSITLVVLERSFMYLRGFKISNR